MRILLDTNVIIRAAQPTLPSWATVFAAMAKLVVTNEGSMKVESIWSNNIVFLVSLPMTQDLLLR